jgi:hypothetical protein
MKKSVNGKDIEMTPQEEAEWTESLKSSQATSKRLREEAEAKISLKASAKAKLIAGEKLTEEEANVLVGV